MHVWQNKVHISAFVRYDFVGFLKPKGIFTIKMFVGFLACVFTTHTRTLSLSSSVCVHLYMNVIVSSCVYNAHIESNLKNINKIRREKMRDGKGSREKVSERNSRIECKKEKKLKAGNWLTCLNHTISALRLCSLY